MQVTFKDLNLISCWSSAIWQVSKDTNSLGRLIFEFTEKLVETVRAQWNEKVFDVGSWKIDECIEYKRSIFDEDGRIDLTIGLKTFFDDDFAVSALDFNSVQFNMPKL